jgi:uracil-DNA glycosylase family 4
LTYGTADDPDLADPTVRYRVYSGRPAAEVAATMPVVPLTAPGLPPLGPGLVAQALAYGDPMPPIVPAVGRKKASQPPYVPGPWGYAVVRSALYMTHTSIGLATPAGVEACTLVPGVERGSKTPGPSRCRLMVVGKCTGPQELQRCQPFVGRGSDSLWEAWRTTGLPQSGDVYLTNLVKFAPPGDMAARALPAGVVKDGLSLLYQELMLVRPEFLLVLGADALKALVKKSASIDNYRGMAFDLAVDCRASADDPPDTHVVRCVACDHPAAVAREPDKYPLLLSGVRMFARTAGYAATTGPIMVGANKPVVKDYQKVVTADELDAAVAESVAASAAGGYVSFDCEWEGAHPGAPGAFLYTVQWSHAPGHARMAFLYREGRVPNPDLPPDRAAAALRRLLCDAPARGARLVAHYGRGDLLRLDAIGVPLYDLYAPPPDDPVGTPNRLMGWQKSYYEGAFDTYVAAHAVDEQLPRKLEMLAAAVLGVDRWDGGMQKWRDAHLHANKMRKDQLGGYGDAPEDVIFDYGCQDVDHPGSLYLLFNGDPRAGTVGTLDRDANGVSARQGFYVQMKAFPAWAEMERYGLPIDLNRHRELRDRFKVAREDILAGLRADLNWPDFAPTKLQHRQEMLFGPRFAKDTGPAAPPGAKTLNMKPYKTTAKFGGRLWDEAAAELSAAGQGPPVPSSDKESLIALQAANPGCKDVIAALRYVDAFGTALRGLLRPPDEVEEADGVETETYESGMLKYLHHDGRTRSMFGLTETGRGTSSKPNNQNLSDAADAVYRAALKDDKIVTRSVVAAPDGWFLVSGDLMGAEIVTAAILSGDELLLDHSSRSTLPETDPNYLDLHADLAVRAFGLQCPPTKAGLKSIGMLHLRTAAKRTRFALYYGGTEDTILRKAQEEDASITLAQIEAVVAGHNAAYPRLGDLFAAARRRVHDPGWICNPFGGIRRFRKGAKGAFMSSQEREAMNYLCQGMVAYAVADGLGNLWRLIRERGLRSKIILSVHDSVLLEVPPEEVVLVADGLIQEAFSDMVPLVPCDLAGRPIRGRGPYRFGVDVSVYRAYGVEVPEAEWRAAA